MSNSGENKPIIPILTGPTGAGKTRVALRLLDKHPDINIISADSRQIYKVLSIGTDKPPADILKKYNFFLTDFVQPGERYTAFDFVRDAEKIIENSLSDGKLPLICGGTGLYIRSLVDGIVEIEDDMNIRQKLETDTIEKGPKYLYEKLQEIDPDEAERIHPHNIKKIIRALEIYYITGKTKSELLDKPSSEKKYSFEIICLMLSRETLYDRINRRVDQMIDDGLVDEIKTIYELNIKEIVEEINVIGYAEMFKYIDGKIDLNTAVNMIKQNSRRFAKRQITWFRGMDNIKYVESAEKALEEIKKFYEI
jgi:tRNA dimethylallyltransferase